MPERCSIVTPLGICPHIFELRRTKTIVPSRTGSALRPKTRRERETPVKELIRKKKRKTKRALPALSEAFVRRLGSCDKAGDGVRVLFQQPFLSQLFSFSFYFFIFSFVDIERHVSRVRREIEACKRVKQGPDLSRWDLSLRGEFASLSSHERFSIRTFVPHRSLGLRRELRGSPSIALTRGETIALAAPREPNLTFGFFTLPVTLIFLIS